MRSVWVVLLGVLHGPLAAAPAATDCLGSASATHGIVYLHSLDGATPSRQETANVALLARVAQQKNLRIAAPRSTFWCGTGTKRQLCWPAENPAAALKTWTAIKASTKSCLAQQQHVGALGFSNGGWFLHKLLRWCIPHGFAWLMGVGAGGTWQRGDPEDLSQCGALSILIGKGDRWNRETAQDFYRLLRAHRAQVELREYEGGHELPSEKQLLSLFDRLRL